MDENEIKNEIIEETPSEDLTTNTSNDDISEASKNEKGKNKSSGKKVKKILIIVLCVLLAIVIALVSAFFILTYVGKSQFHKGDTHIINDAVEIEDDTTIVYNGKKYILNKNIVSILVMGIDRSNLNDDLGKGKNGQADVIFLATVDTQTKKVNIIPISRETMTDVNIYTTNGKYIGTEKAQLCLAYAYGSTPLESSKNMLTSVKRLFYSININSYVTIEMEGLAKLTEIIGGVEVNSLEDFKYRTTIYEKGKNINLIGESALGYVRYRTRDLDSNNNRMQRQKQFLTALMNKAGNTVMQDFTKLGSIYNDLSPYFSSNVSIAQITYLAKECLSMNFGDSMNYKNIEGEITQGEKWAEFTPDEDALLQTVIDIFYLPKN